MPVNYAEPQEDLIEKKLDDLAKELHDGPLQHLAALSIQLCATHRLIEMQRRTEAEATLHKMSVLLDGELDRLRRMIQDLRMPGGPLCALLTTAA